MKKFFLMISAIFLLGTTVNATPVQWEASKDGNDHWYELVEFPFITWTDAVQEAKDMGGYLATITSAEENKFIFGLGVSDNPYWLGGSDIDEEGKWTWITGEEWVYVNWADGEPNNSNNEDSLAFAWFKADGTWNDAPTAYDRYEKGGFVVEYNPVPEPATMLLFGIGLLGLAGVSRRRK